MARSKGPNRALIVVGSVVAFFLVLCSFGAVIGLVAGTSTDEESPNADKQRPARTVASKSSDDEEPSPAADDAGSEKKRKHKKDRETPAPDPEPAEQEYQVVRVIDGDTLELGNGQTVRLVGIDTPERGQCGYDQATQNLQTLVGGQAVTLSQSDEDTDRYGRLLRYVNVGALDAGYRQLRDGYAIARYDSRDGYGFHPREPAYIKADKANPQYKCAPEPEPETDGDSGCSTGYSPCLPPAPPDLDCEDVNGPVIVTGSDPHQLDADGDGVACE